jgi:hypothetical protein
MRGETFWELIEENPFAFALAAVIAQRARYTIGFHAHNLELGEAFLGDYERYGMSERQYRTAKHLLAKWGLATFKPTNKGTIGKLTDTRLFCIFRSKTDGQNDRQPTGKRQASDEQTTTNKEQKNRRTEGGEPPGDGWKLPRDAERLKKLIAEEENRQEPDRALISSYRQELREIEEEQKRRRPPKCKKPKPTAPPLPERNCITEVPTEVWQQGCDEMRKAVDET